MSDGNVGIDWRNILAQEIDADDELLGATPPDVVAELGFDPLDLEDLEDGGLSESQPTTPTQLSTRVVPLPEKFNRAWENKKVLRERFAKAFDEAKHPRASDGRFGDKAGQGGGGGSWTDKEKRTLDFLKKQKSSDKAIKKAAGNLNLTGNKKQSFINEAKQQRGNAIAKTKERQSESRKIWSDYVKQYPRYHYQIEGHANPMPLARGLSKAAEQVAATPGWSEEAHTSDSTYFRHKSGARLRVANHPPIYLRSTADGNIYPSEKMQWLRESDVSGEVASEIQKAIGKHKESYSLRERFARAFSTHNHPK